MNISKFEEVLLQFMTGSIDLDKVLSILSNLEDSNRYYTDVYKLLDFLREGDVRQFFNKALQIYYSTNFKDTLDLTSPDRIPFLLSLDSVISFINSLKEIYYTNRIELLKDLIVGIDRGYNLWKNFKNRKKAQSLQKMKGYTFGLLGIELMEQGKYDDAANYLLKALDIHNTFREQDLLKIDLFNLAVCMLEMKRYDDAIYYLEKYQKMEDDLTVKKYLGIAYFLKKQYNNAKKIFEVLLRDYTNEKQDSSEILYYLAFTNFVGYLEGTIPDGLEKGEQYTKELLSAGAFWTLNALLIRGTFYFIIGEYDKAADDYSDAISIIIDYYKFKNRGRKKKEAL